MINTVRGEMTYVEYYFFILIAWSRLCSKLPATCLKGIESEQPVSCYQFSQINQKDERKTIAVNSHHHR